MNQDSAMEKVAANLPSKSAKMRALAEAGYRRGDIARYLGTSYQFVRNVLLKEEARTAEAQAKKHHQAKLYDSGINTVINRTVKVKLGPDGSIVVPAALREAIGAKEGDTLIAEVDNGELRFLTIPAAVRKAQAMIRKFIPEGVSLVDELLEDRRREVEREQQDG
jgi:AbrB family looped-hinge helix DNA binding protein